MGSIIDLLSNLPQIEPNEDYYDGGIEDIELDKIIEKMRAHGLKNYKKLSLCIAEMNTIIKINIKALVGLCKEEK